VKELLARVEAVLRRSPQRSSDPASIGISGGEIDLRRREVRFSDGWREELTEREADLLRYLAGNPSRAIAREELLDHVWGLSPEGVSTRTIDMLVARLREKLRDDARQPGTIVTVRGKGYMWKSEE
jgi:DNA-binding response OmpR family regulator